MALKEPCPLSSAYDAPTTELTLPRLRGVHVVDVVIIGAGVTGCSTALHLAEAGKSVSVLESGPVAWGGSGRAFGLIVAYAKHGHDQLFARYGAERGARLSAALADGPDMVFDRIDRHSIDCDADRNGWILAAHKPSAREGLRKRAEFWARRGAQVEYLDQEETCALTGSQRYTGAMLDKRSGGLNPLKYTRGLAQAAITAGAEIFENSEAISITPGSAKCWRVSTAQGHAEADHVIHCTNAYTGKLWPGLAQTIIPLRAYQLVSAPLSDTEFESVLPGGQVMTDTRHLFSGIRKLPGQRLHVSTGGPVMTSTGKPDIAEAQTRLAETYPELDRVEWADIWTAWVGVNAEQTPRITRLDDGMWAAIGYSGRGIAFGTVMGAELEKLISDPTRDDLILPVETIRKQPFHTFAPLGAAAMVKWYSVVDRMK